MSISRHFKSTSYCFFKYKGCVNVKRSSYEKRPEKYFYEKLATKYNYNDAVSLFVSFYSYPANTSFFIADVQNTEFQDNFTQWERRIQSITFSFEQELITLKDTVTSFNDIFTSIDGNHPIIIQQLLGGFVSLETVCLLDKIIHFASNLDKSLESDFVWEILSLRIRKYSQFLNVQDIDKYKKIIISQFSS